MRSTPVHFSKGENPVLSNFYPSKIFYRSRLFNCVEGAYQAYKTGFYVAGFEDLDGYASKNLARKLGLKRKEDEVFTINLMRELLQLRAEQDAEFNIILRESENITHPVGDPFWREWFPRLLNQLRDKLRKEVANAR